MDDMDGYIMYLSGPITHDPDYMGKFAAAERFLASRGCRVLNPAKVSAQLPELEHWQYMEVCLAMLGIADGIWLMDGWEASEGAGQEYDFVMRKNAGIESRMPMECGPFIEIWEGGKLSMDRRKHELRKEAGMPGKDSQRGLEQDRDRGGAARPTLLAW